MTIDRPLVLIRGGGDLATGVAQRLYRSGFWTVVLEIEKPLAVRRLVSLAEAVYEGEVTIEELQAKRVRNPQGAIKALKSGWIPVLVDPLAESRLEFNPVALVDGRMLKAPPELDTNAADLVIGLGPGFTAGVDCHAVIETNRGHMMGRVFWQGSAETDTAIPGRVANYDTDRVLRAPTDGRFEEKLPLASSVQRGDVIATIDHHPLEAPFDGTLRGLLHSGVEVVTGMKVGDLDPRANPEYCFLISDKALAVGGGVLEALLSHPAIRSRLGS